MPNFFKKIFGSKSFFGTLDLVDKWNLSYLLGMSEFLLRRIDEDFLQALKSVYKNNMSIEQERRISTEFALSVIFSATIPIDDKFKKSCSFTESEYRRYLSKIVLTLKSDSRTSVDVSSYSSSPFEAKIQCLLTVAEELDKSDDGLFQLLKSDNRVSESWNSFTSDFFSTVLSTINKQNTEALFNAFEQKYEALSDKSKNVIGIILQENKTGITEESITVDSDKSPNKKSVTKHSAEELFTELEKSSKKLKNLLKNKVFPEGFPLPMSEVMIGSWEPYCLCYCTMLMFAAQLSKDVSFAKGDVFLRLYALALNGMVELEKGLFREINALDKYDEEEVTKRLKTEFDEAEEALLHYIDNYSKEKFPDMKLMGFLVIKTNVTKEFRIEVMRSLHDFNKLTLASFRNF